MQGGKVYDLEERTAQFGEQIIELVRKIPKNEITQRLVPQLVAAGTAIGANYCEADGAESHKDFLHKLSIANKEVKETKHFLRMMATATPSFISECRELWEEANELNHIFSSIISKGRKL